MDTYFIAASIAVESEDRLATIPATVSEQEPMEVVPVANAAGLVALLGGFWRLRTSQEEARKSRTCR